MWSVRMRASQKRANEERHISGAEGIFEYEGIERAVKKLLRRAFEHSRGRPDRIVITVEKITDEITTIPCLSLNTYFASSPENAYEKIFEILGSLGISEKAINRAFDVIKKESMRGATLIDSISGERLEKDKARGVRVSRIQMDKRRGMKLMRKVRKLSTEPQRVLEAITVASKVASCPEIIAELCISDNPDYTTGYIASSNLGYLRITNIKNRREEIGGRAFFVKTPCDIENLIYYLERKPVLVI